MEKTVYIQNEKGLWVCEAGEFKGETITLTQFYGRFPFPQTHEYYAPRPGVLEVYLRGTYREKPTTGKAAKAAKPEPTPAPAPTVKVPENKDVKITPPGRYYDLLGGAAQGTLF